MCIHTQYTRISIPFYLFVLKNFHYWKSYFVILNYLRIFLITDCLFITVLNDREFRRPNIVDVRT